LINKILVIADLHIGIEYEFFRSGIIIPSQTENIKRKISMLIKMTRPKKIILLGDLKHKVPGMSFQEMREIPEFADFLSRKAKLEIVPGNHDTELKKALNKKIKIHPNRGVFLPEEKVYLAHGHAWPSDKFLNAEYVVIGHNHPQIEFKNKLGFRWRLPVWVKAGLNRKKIQARYKTKAKDLPKLIIMPAFNELAGGYPVNRKDGKEEFIGPLIKCMDANSAKLYLLDGTYLGNLSKFYK
jgi:putative SbcD/Mre11-related phosphoesterase